MQMIPIMKPIMDEREAQAASRPILSGWVTQGPEVKAFEEEFAQVTGAKYACAVSSCTTALHLALLAVGVGPGDEVVTASHSFIATANAIAYCGAKPIFVDIDPATFNMDPKLVEQAIGPKTKAILCVHQMGMPCDLQAILKIAHSHKLPVIEDAACAIGSEIVIDGSAEKIGKPRGDIACFSFHPRKLVSTGDGGMLTTNNPEYDKQFRLLRQHGMSVPDTVRHASSKVVFEGYPVVGYNYRMTDIQAAVGRVQLERLPEIVERRRSLAKRYIELLRGIDGLILPHEPAWAKSNWQSFCVRLPEHANQEAVMQFMLDRAIATRRGIMCSHKELAYPQGTWSCQPNKESCQCGTSGCTRLRHSEKAQEKSIILPLFHQLAEHDQDRIAESLAESLAAKAVAAT